MPPRLPALSAYCRVMPGAPRPSVLFLLPFTQGRAASILASLSDNPGAYNKRIRRGRGPSSGKGKTSGRGHKGQKAHGHVHPRFQGGQTPQATVHGDIGFKNPFSVEMSPVNLNRIQFWIDQGRLDPTQPITLKELVESRCIHGIKDGVKVLAKGKEDLKTPINILVSRASTEAIKAIEAVGGQVTTRYYTRPSIRRILRGESESSFTPLSMKDEDGSPILSALASNGKPFKYRLPDPTSRKDVEYYRDVAHRGYLSHLVEEGHGPSLYFKMPGSGTKRRTTKTKGGKDELLDNKLW